jgi:outer membrane protein assembly factor BamB
MRAFFASRSLLAACLLLASARCALAENWPQWRGPRNDGTSLETNLPTEWSNDKNIAWKLPLPGKAGSTPVIWGDRIFLTSEDKGDVVLLCVSTEGKELWKRKLGKNARIQRSEEGNGASPSPSTDGKHVYTYTGNGDFACFDLDGKEVWSFNAQERYGRFQTWHGMHTTPLIHGDRLYLVLMHTGGAWVIALDKATGKEVWKVKRPSDARVESEHSYASPVLWHKDKEEYLVAHGADYATAHRLEDGKEIWRVGGLNPKVPRYNQFFRFVASPVATADLIVVPSAKYGPVVGVKPDASGLLLPGSKGEQWRLPRGTPDVSSPLVQDGLVYLCHERGLLSCLDAKTGKKYYSEERLHEARYRASPVYADGKIYLTARDGTVSVVKAGPKFELLAENRLRDQTASSPVISGGRIYLRGFESLYAIGPSSK